MSHDLAGAHVRSALNPSGRDSLGEAQGADCPGCRLGRAVTRWRLGGYRDAWQPVEEVQPRKGDEGVICG